MFLKSLSASAVTLTLILSWNISQAQTVDSTVTSISFIIPQRSGLAFADFRHYRVENNTLKVLYQATTLDTTHSYELEEAYSLRTSDLRRLEILLQNTDSFGFHTNGNISMGWPRFLINATYNGKSFDGFVANCYREHIYVFVDWLNSVYPNGDVMRYNKEELIRREENSSY